MPHLNRYNLFSSFQSAYHLVTVLKLPFLKLSMTFFWQSMRLSCRFWYSLTYLQHLIPLIMIYYSITYNMCLVFKALCYLGSDLISLKDYKLFQFKVLILTKLNCVVPQGSVLGPILFILCTQPLDSFSDAEDMQVYKSFDFNDCLSSILCVEKCVSDVKTWMTSKLQMNEDKTEVLLVTAKRVANLQHLPEFMNINGTCVNFS